MPVICRMDIRTWRCTSGTGRFRYGTGPSSSNDL